MTEHRTSGRLQASFVLLLSLFVLACPDQRPAGTPDTAAIAAAAGAEAHLGMGPGDEQIAREVQDYRLTMPRVQQYAQAVRNLQTLERTDPALRTRMEALGGREDQSLTEITQGINEEPRLRAAIEGTGLSVREYMVLSLAFMQAYMAHEMQRQGLMQELPPGVPPENVAFVRENQAALQPMMQELERGEEP